MIYKQRDRVSDQFTTCQIVKNVMFDIYSPVPLFEFHIPKEVTLHDTWKMYDRHATLQALYAHPESEIYETFDGALYNKRTQTLLYVPSGKTSLHIPKHIKNIGYHALNRIRLESITVDPENPFFWQADGNLYDHNMERLYFVPPECKTLFIASTVRKIDSAVLMRNFEEIVVCAGNPIFKVINGTLFRESEMVYICPNVQSLNIPADTDILFLNKLEGAINLEEIIFPDQLLSLGKVQIERYPNLKKISVHVNTRFTARSFKALNKNCHIFVRLDDHTAIELPKTTSQALTQCIRFLKGAGAEVKSGTELFYLDCFLLKLNQSSIFLRVINVSSWQIIKCVIEKNDIQRMKEILRDGRLLTRKNIKRAIRFAMTCGNMELHALLHAFSEEN